MITGAGGAIGRACVKQFARDGCRRIVGLDLSRDGLQEIADQIQGEHRGKVEFMQVHVDLTDEKQVQTSFEQIRARFGRIDYAVNNAGISQRVQTTPESTVDELEKVMAVNTKGVWLCVREELRIMEEQPIRPVDPNSEARPVSRGSIVNITSILGRLAMPGLSLYVMSKFSTEGLSKVDALDFAKHGIRVNTIMPGFVDTPLSTPSLRAALQPSIDKTPMGRMALPREIADSAAFLASDRSSYITGSSLVVDGGYTIH